MALFNIIYFFFILNTFKFQLITVLFGIYPKKLKMFAYQTLNRDVSSNYSHHFLDLKATKMYFGRCIQTMGYY